MPIFHRRKSSDDTELVYIYPKNEKEIETFRELLGSIISKEEIEQKFVKRAEYGEEIYAIELTDDQYKTLEKQLPEDESLLSENPLFEAAAEHLRKLITTPYDAKVYSDKGTFGFALEIDGEKTYRHNHGLAHSLRVSFFLPQIVKWLTKYFPETYEGSLYFSEQNILLLQIAMMFTVVGRKNEIGWTAVDPEIQKICTALKNEIYTEADSKDEWVRADLYESMILDTIGALDEADRKILDEALQLLENRSQDEWIDSNKEFFKNYDSFLKQKAPQLYDKILKLPDKTPYLFVEDLYRYYPALIIDHYVTYETLQMDPTELEKKRQIHSKLKQTLENNPQKQKLIKSIIDQTLNNTTYNCFRENSAEAFKKFCLDSGLVSSENPMQLKMLQQLYHAVRFMGNPTYRGNEYLLETKDRIRTFCSLLSLSHDIDLNRCFQKGAQDHFNEFIELTKTLSPEKQKTAKEEIIALHQYVAACQEATGDQIQERILGDGNFLLYANYMAYGPQFITCNNQVSSCLNILRKLPTPFPNDLELAKEKISASLPKAIGIDWKDEAQTVDIHFKEEAVAREFIVAMQKQLPEFSLDFTDPQLSEKGAKISCSQAQFREKVEPYISYEIPIIPKELSLEHELFSEKELTCFSLFKEGRAVGKNLSFTYANNEFAFDFHFKQLNDPMRIRPIPRRIHYTTSNNAIISPIYERHRDQVQRYNQTIKKWEQFKTGYKLAKMPPLANPNDAAKYSRRTKKTLYKIKGGFKLTIYPKKNSHTLYGPKGRIQHRLPETSVGIFSDLDLAHLKNEKYIYEINAATNERYYIPTGKTPEKFSELEETIENTKPTTIKALQEKLKATEDVANPVNELLICVPKIASRAFFAPRDERTSRLIAAFTSAHCRTLYGLDLPVLIVDGQSDPKIYEEKVLLEDLRQLRYVDPETKKIIQEFLLEVPESDNEAINNYLSDFAASNTNDEIVAHISKHINLLCGTPRALTLMGEKWDQLSADQKFNFLLKQVRLDNFPVLIAQYHNKLDDFVRTQPKDHVQRLIDAVIIQMSNSSAEGAFLMALFFDFNNLADVLFLQQLMITLEAKHGDVEPVKTDPTVKLSTIQFTEGYQSKQMDLFLWSIRYGYQKIIKYLLQTDQVKVEDYSYSQMIAVKSIDFTDMRMEPSTEAFGKIYGELAKADSTFKGERATQALIATITENAIDLIPTFIAQGADINRCDTNNNTVLLTAALRLQDVITRAFPTLIQSYKADLNAKDNEGNTLILSLAKKKQWMHVHDLIRTYPMKLDAQNNQGENIFLLASKDVTNTQFCWHIVSFLYEKYLTDKTLNFGFKNLKPDDPIVTAAIYLQEWELVITLFKEMKPTRIVETELLSSAVQNRQWELVRLLIEKFEVPVRDLNFKRELTYDEWPFIHHVVLSDQWDLANWLIKENKVDAGYFVSTYSGLAHAATMKQWQTVWLMLMGSHLQLDEEKWKSTLLTMFISATEAGAWDIVLYTLFNKKVSIALDEAKNYFHNWNTPNSRLLYSLIERLQTTQEPYDFKTLLSFQEPHTQITHHLGELALQKATEAQNQPIMDWLVENSLVEREVQKTANPSSTAPSSTFFKPAKDAIKPEQQNEDLPNAGLHE